MAKTSKILYLTWMRKFIGNELEPFGGVPAVGGLEVVTKVTC
jgi:hypothetical protein